MWPRRSGPASAMRRPIPSGPATTRRRRSPLFPTGGVLGLGRLLRRGRRRSRGILFSRGGLTGRLALPGSFGRPASTAPAGGLLLTLRRAALALRFLTLGRGLLVLGAAATAGWLRLLLGLLPLLPALFGRGRLLLPGPGPDRRQVDHLVLRGRGPSMPGITPWASGSGAGCSGIITPGSSEASGNASPISKRAPRPSQSVHNWRTALYSTRLWFLQLPYPPFPPPLALS